MSISLLKIRLERGRSPYEFGGGGGSTTSSAATTTTTTTNNNDKRMVVSDSAIGVSGGDGSTFNISSSDQGAMKAASDMFKMATDANSHDYTTLLSTSGDSIKGVMALASKAVDSSFSAAQAANNNAVAMLDTAQSKGTIDNKTMIMLGGCAVAAVALYTLGK